MIQKQRREKLTKRSKSLKKKVKELARLTDAHVAFFISDGRGPVDTITSSPDRNWPPSIQTVMVSRSRNADMAITNEAEGSESFGHTRIHTERRHSRLVGTSRGRRKRLRTGGRVTREQPQYDAA